MTRLISPCIVTIWLLGLLGCGRAASTYDPVYSPQKSEAESSLGRGTSNSGNDKGDTAAAGQGEAGQTAPKKSSNGLGSLEEQATRGTTGSGDETVSDCKYFKKDGTTRFSEAHPIDIPLPLNTHFDGDWNEDDSEYSFTMVIGEHVDKRQIGDICFDDPENMRCAGKEPYQLITKGTKIGDRYSEHFFDVRIVDANSSDCRASVSRR